MSQRLNQVKKFILDSVSEAKKITWPTRQQLLQHSIIVVGALIISLAVIAAVDYGLSEAVSRFVFGV